MELEQLLEEYSSSLLEVSSRDDSDTDSMTDIESVWSDDSESNFSELVEVLVVIEDLESRNRDPLLEYIIWYKFLKLIKQKLSFDPQSIMTLFSNWCFRYNVTIKDPMISYKFLLDLFSFTIMSLVL